MSPFQPKADESITDALRRAVIESEESIAALSRETSITRQTLMRFSRGDTSIYLDAADRLATHFGVRLCTKKR